MQVKALKFSTFFGLFCIKENSDEPILAVFYLFGFCWLLF